MPLNKTFKKSIRITKTEQLLVHQATLNTLCTPTMLCYKMVQQIH